MRQGTNIILRIISILIVVYVLLILNNQLADIRESLNSLTELLGNSWVLGF